MHNPEADDIGDGTDCKVSYSCTSGIVLILLRVMLNLSSWIMTFLLGTGNHVHHPLAFL